MATAGSVNAALPSPSRWRFRLLLGATLTVFYLFAFNLYQYLRYLPGRPEVSDFRAFYSAARVGLASGWWAVYERAQLEPLQQSIWPKAPYVAFLNPPPLAWLFVPVSGLPPRTAFFGWAGLQALILAGCALACAPPRPLPRLAAVLSALALLPTYTVVTYGMVTPLVLAGLVGCWALLRADRQVAAGVALAALALKPQVALVVPLALLAAGRLRCVAAWAATTAVLALLSLAAIGQAGAAAWLQGLHDISQEPFVARYSIGDIVGGGGPGWVARGVVIALTLWAAWASRRRGPEIPISAGVVASLLVSSHITPGDFVMVLLPVWLLLRTAPALDLMLLLGLLWFAAWLSPGPALPIVLAQLALLIRLGAIGTFPSPQTVPSREAATGHNDAVGNLPLTPLK